MTVTTTGFIRRLDFSDLFCNFTPYHHTFGKYRETYNADITLYDDFEVIKLHKKDNLGTTIVTPVDDAHLADIFAITHWLFSESIGGLLTLNTDSVNAELAARFDSASLNVWVESMASDDDQGIILPNKLFMRYTEGSDINYYEFHFNTLTFEAEYSNYDIEVICPTEHVDDLLLDKDTVQNLINQRGIAAYADALNVASRENPYTSTTGFDVLWVNKDTMTDKLQIRFNFIIYGNAINDSVALNLAIRSYVENNTSAPISVWEIVLPEIFTATTFLAIPDWDKVSIGSASNSIYNPISSHLRLVDFFKNNITSYNGSFVDENYQTMPTVWQSLVMGVCGAPSNREDYYQLSATLDDYILVEPDSEEFIRMSPSTQDFIIKLNNALPSIQDYTSGSAVPSGLDIEIIDGFKFFVFSSYNIKFKILCKEDFINIISKE